MKPCTVLYGRSLPEEYWAAVASDFPRDVDLVIVAGTSLTVGPANLLPLRVAPGTPRLVVNRERVGEAMGFDYRDDAEGPGGGYAGDGFVGGDSDAAFAAIAAELGWLDDLRALAASGECDFCPASRAALGLPTE